MVDATVQGIYRGTIVSDWNFHVEGHTVANGSRRDGRKPGDSPPRPRPGGSGTVDRTGSATGPATARPAAGEKE